MGWDLAVQVGMSVVGRQGGVGELNCSMVRHWRFHD